MKTNPQMFYIKELWSRDRCSKIINSNDALNELDQYKAFLNETLTLVGIYQTEGGLNLYCCPKYISDEDITIANNGGSDKQKEIQQHMLLVCRVFEKLRSENKNIPEIDREFSEFDKKLEKKSVNRFELAKSIVQDYLENGLYYSSEKKIHISGKGKIRWGLTIRKKNPVISDGNPVYMQLLRQEDYQNYDNFLTDIHANVILQCARYLQALGLFNNIDLPSTDRTINESEMHNLIRYVNERLSEAFTNRDIGLFKAIISWCGKSRYYKSRGCTTSFLHVWEWVNDVVWGNVSQDEAKSSLPRYCFGNHSEYMGTGDAIPDTITVIRGDNNQKLVAIFDSKYYVPIYFRTENGQGNNSVNGLPSNKDIAKQVAYLESIRSLYGDDEIQYSNIFLLPYNKIYSDQVHINEFENNTLYRYVGKVYSGNFISLENKIEKKAKTENNSYVGLVLINPTELYNQYLNKGWIGKSAIMELSTKWQS